MRHNAQSQPLALANQVQRLVQTPYIGRRRMMGFRQRELEASRRHVRLTDEQIRVKAKEGNWPQWFVDMRLRAVPRQ